MYSQEQIKTAMLEAANFIDEDSKRYEFLNFSKPNPFNATSNSQTKGCLLGWIGFFLGVDSSEIWGYPLSIAEIIFPHVEGNAENFFYKKLDSFGLGFRENMDDAGAATKALRQLAEEYA